MYIYKCVFVFIYTSIDRYMYFCYISVSIVVVSSSTFTPNKPRLQCLQICGAAQMLTRRAFWNLISFMNVSYNIYIYITCVI